MIAALASGGRFSFSSMRRPPFVNPIRDRKCGLGCMKCNPALPARHGGSKCKRRGITHPKGGASAPSCSEAKDGDTSCAREGRSPLAQLCNNRSDDNERVCRVCFQISHTLLPFALFSGRLATRCMLGFDSLRDGAAICPTALKATKRSAVTGIRRPRQSSLYYPAQSLKNRNLLSSLIGATVERIETFLSGPQSMQQNAQLPGHRNHCALFRIASVAPGQFQSPLF